MKLLAYLLAAILIVANFAGVCVYGADNDTKTLPSNKVLRIYSWNDVFENTIKTSGYTLPEGYEIEYVVVENQGEAYWKALDKELEKQLAGNSDRPVDIFITDTYYMTEYNNSPYTLDLKKAGIADKDTTDMFQYTLDLGTNRVGELKAVTWEITPSLFIYRRSIAKEVLGDDDPEFVSTRVNTWNNFERVASMMKRKGYFMLVSPEDSYTLFSSNRQYSWVGATTNKIQVDKSIRDWVDMFKRFDDNGYVTSGSFVHIANGSDNIDLAVDLIRTVCSDKDAMEEIAVDYKSDGGSYYISVNNRYVMNKIANSDYKSEVLGGQNPFGLYLKTADKIKLPRTTEYDVYLDENFIVAFNNYFNGTVTKRQALDNFYALALEEFPELKR